MNVNMETNKADGYGHGCENEKIVVVDMRGWWIEYKYKYEYNYDDNYNKDYNNNCCHSSLFPMYFSNEK